MRRGRGSSVARRGQYSQRRATCGSRSLPAIDRPLQLLLVHLGAAVDAHPLGLVVELLLRAALRPVGAGALAEQALRLALGDAAGVRELEHDLARRQLPPER